MKSFGPSAADKIVIIGGGVIGLSIGWHLRKLGAVVSIFEKGNVGCEASFAAAGMITPVSEVRFGEENLLQLFLESLRAYSLFIQEIESASSLSTDFQTTGSLMVAIDHDDEQELNRLYHYQKELGLNAEWINPTQITEQEPLMTHQCVAAVKASDECFVDNIKLVEALKQAFLKSGGSLFENCPVESLEIVGNRITSIWVKGEKTAVSAVVLASGIHRIKGLPDDFEWPLRPVKGQALEVRNRQPISLSRAVRTIHRFPVYLVPRSDGRIVIGATSEEMGHDTTLTSGALLDLLYGAWKVMPSIYDMPVVRTWTGLRPTSRDHAPILGPTEIDGLYTALGMYRHGILLTPIVGKLMAELIAKETNSNFFETFGITRFKCLKSPTKHSIPASSSAPPDIRI